MNNVNKLQQDFLHLITGNDKDKQRTVINQQNHHFISVTCTPVYGLEIEQCSIRRRFLVPDESGRICMTHVPETGAGRWSRFMAPVSGACVMRIRVELRCRPGVPAVMTMMSCCHTAAPWRSPLAPHSIASRSLRCSVACSCSFHLTYHMTTNSKFLP